MKEAGNVKRRKAQGVKEGARCKVQGIESEDVRRRAFGARRKEREHQRGPKCSFDLSNQ